MKQKKINTPLKTNKPQQQQQQQQKQSQERTINIERYKQNP